MFLRGCEEAGIPAEVISSTKALDLVPNLNPELEEAIKVPDCSIDPFRLCMLNIQTSRLRDGIIFTRHKVTEIVQSHGRCIGVRATDQGTGEIREIRANIIVNASGAWANLIASLAGSEVPMTLSKGSLVITNHRLTSMVINRLRPPSDGDIVVPNEAVCLAGTTSLMVEDPDKIRIEPAEVDIITDEVGKNAPPLQKHPHHPRFFRRAAAAEILKTGQP